MTGTVRPILIIAVGVTIGVYAGAYLVQATLLQSDTVQHAMFWWR